MNMMESPMGGAKQPGRPRMPGEYAGDYEKEVISLIGQEKELVEKMTNSPGKLKRVYEDLLWKTREDIINLKKGKNIGLTSIEKAWEKEIEDREEGQNLKEAA